MRLRAAFLLLGAVAIVTFSGCSHGQPRCRWAGGGEVCVTVTCRDYQGRYVKCPSEITEKECRP